MRILLAIFAIGFLSISCSNDIPSDKALDSKLKSKILSGADKLVMAELTDFKWDSLLILTPYSVLDSVESKFNIKLARIKHTGIEFLDHINVLVYLNNGEVVNMVEYERYPGDFSNDRDFSIDGAQLIPKSKAIFRITVTNQKSVSEEDWIEVERIK